MLDGADEAEFLISAKDTDAARYKQLSYVIFTQPALITGAKLKNYQLEGLQWLVSLHQNGISGILADEMGLGKTLQTIAFSAYLREERFSMPFMVVCPLSVLHNWVSEYEKFAPDIPVCMYHGTRDERAELRRTVMALPITKKKAPVKKAKPKAKRQRGARRSGRQSRKKAESEEEPEEEEDEDETDLEAALAFPVVITTYEMIMKDRAQLAHYNWGYIVVDEGHRLKNLNCQLMKEIKKYSSAGRMILTGTPLQNNLSELWALMTFVLPDLFSDVDSFDEWFNLPAMQQHLGSDRSTQVVDALHAILKPFLLRRMKTDVETSLLPKKEYVLYAPLSEQQREAYTQVVNGTLRSYLIGGAPVEPTEPVAVTEKSITDDHKADYSCDRRPL
ncbi:lymphoid-specific helicase isoform 5-like protein [Mycena floridula]|nr:lymphoid-specific helicase isoform 5-like protein [Mycena floridula]